MNFKQFNFHPDIQRAIPFDTPTPIQAQSIPAILAGKDIVASAETGSGKTAAFVLPSLQQLVSKKGGRKPQILVLTPTRELAAQVTKETGNFGKFLKLNVISLVGGVSYHQQLKNLSQNVDMVVATPGRLIDHMENGKIDLSDIKKLVLDEADRMLDMGFSDDVRKIAAATPKHRQTILFSATVDDSLKPMIKELLNQPERINLSNEKIAPTRIEQILYMADDHKHKKKLLEHMLANENIYKAIIFCETKRATDQIADELYANGYAASSINGDLKQNVRNRRLEQFRRGKIQFLIATDVAARGIDVSDLTHVINYDIPRFADSYVHRIGRTGRAGNEGTAISFALMSDGLQIKKIERYIGINLKRATIEGLEPTKRESAHAPRGNKPKTKRFKNSKPAFSRNQSFKPRKAKRKIVD